MIPAAIELVPIDDAARDGGYKLLLGEGQFAVARWTADRWAFSNGRELHFKPSAYRRPPAEDLAA